VGDGGYRDGANKFMRAPNDPLGDRIAHSGTQAFRHRGGTNVVYVDSHGAAVRQKHRKPGVRASIEVMMDFPNNAFLSADDLAYSIR
jgi:prepilin-type processing-associated H-X9-DG protein